MKVFKKAKARMAIVGHGFVGKATDWGFNKNIEKFIVDPLLGTSINDLKKFNPDYVFICVPTPMKNDGTQDSSIIREVVYELHDKCPKSIKVVKSTVIPSILTDLVKVDQRLIYNPEFLREKYANEDFVNTPLIILGGDRNICSLVSKLYLNHSRCKTKEHVFTEIQSASLIKYSINTFLATKVIFFNEIFKIYEKLELNDSWELLINAISIDQRIGSSHMNVPGHDGRKGFGGACFPKDSNALIKYAASLDIELNTLKAAIKENNKIRSTYKNLELRELEQNISFDDKI